MRKAKRILSPILAVLFLLSLLPVSLLGATEKVEAQFDQEYDAVYTFSEGIALVENGGLYGYVDSSGVSVTQLIYAGGGQFSGGFGSLQWNGKWGYVNSNGVAVTAFVYDEAGPFSEDLANVKSAGEWGYIDQYGNVTISFAYDTADPFIDDLARVSKENKYGFITNKEFVVIPLVYDGASLFSPVSELAWVWQDNKMGLIDKSGEFVIPLSLDYKYTFLDAFAGDLWLVRDNYDGQYGFINKTGAEVGFGAYEWIGNLYGGKAWFKKDDGYGIVSLTFSNTARLADLTVSSGALSPAFAPEETSYTVSVPNAVSSIDLTATVADYASIKGAGSHSLNVGENEINIIVTSEDGTASETYTVIVTRAAADTSSGDDNSGNTVTTPAGQPPVINPDGSSTLPGGGTVATADGARIAVPAGATIDKDGNVAIPADKEAKGALSEGVSATFPGGSIINNEGLVIVGTGVAGSGAKAEVALSGGAAIAAPAGSVIGDGAIRLPLDGSAGKITYLEADGTVGEIEIQPGYAVEIVSPDLPGTSGLEIFFNSPAIRFDIGQTGYQAKGEAKEAQSPAFIENGRTYLGVRDIGNALGGEIAWDRASNTASLSKNGITVLATVGQGYIRVIGKDGVERREPIDTPALNRDGRVYLPSRAILGAFGYSVAWDGASRSVSVTR
ncbi:MAG: WG repeat-containing protein [Peptococcaceae bacterium]|jgi:hypothetical protein|nr:WG repeat-containing protein [Peptococcaceae bacterium]